MPGLIPDKILDYASIYGQMCHFSVDICIGCSNMSVGENTLFRGSNGHTTGTHGTSYSIWTIEFIHLGTFRRYKRLCEGAVR